MTNSVFDRLVGWLTRRQVTSPTGRALLLAARHAAALAGDLAEGDLTLHATSLVYTSLLSLVPLLALAFSVLKALGLHNSLQPLLLQFFAPLGADAPLLASNIIGFVNNMRVGVLGSVGVVLLLYTAVSMIHKVETSFNVLWNIAGTRSLPQRFGEYLSMMILGPTVVIIALGLTSSMVNAAVAARLHLMSPVGLLLSLLGRATPYLLMIAALGFVYFYIPNTRVRFRAAGVAGVVAGITWQAASAVFATFVSRATNYNAIYSGFAIIIFVLIWLYVSWLIVLLGCRLAYYLQNPRQLQLRRGPLNGSRELEAVAIEIVAIIGLRFLKAQPAADRRELQCELGLPQPFIDRAVRALVVGGILAETGSDNRLLPARDLASVTLAEVWRQVRGDWPTPAGNAALASRIEALLRGLEKRDDAWEQRSLRDWLLEL